MYTLGIHGGINTISGFVGATPLNWMHDAAAVLCKDGEVVAAAEEERFVRIKHVNYFPIEAIRYCLTDQGIALTDVEKIVVTSEHANEYLRMTNRWRFGTRAWREPSSYLVVAARILQDELGADVRDRLQCAGHHRSHALSATWQSGFDSALCVVLDAWGDGRTGMIDAFHDGSLELLRELRLMGPAALYLTGTELLGFSQFDEYKVMGLAPYGDPARYLPQLLDLVTLQPEGRFECKPASLSEELFTAARAPGAPLERRHMDFAAALQAVTERIVFHVLEHFRKETGLERLCLAGGLGQNCTANGKLLAARLFDDIFVQPVAYDAGCAVGAAIHGFVAAGGRMRSQRLSHLYRGPSATVDPAALQSTWRRWRRVIEVEPQPDAAASAAQLIADGQVVAWVQGRAEFGARALGNRSILADPRPSINKERINAMVKRRESFRPFAPAVLEEHLHEYFEVPPSVKSLPFMVFVVKVREQYRKLLGAVTHVDGTARVQSVARDRNPRFWQLIANFAELTGIPVVLNTSFNNNAEPIVNTTADALNCFLSTHLDALFVGDYLIKRRKAPTLSVALRHLIPRMSARFAAIRHCGDRQHLGHALHDRHTDRYLPVSAEAHSCLVRAAELEAPFGRVLPREAARADPILDELFELWCRRVFACEGSSPERDCAEG